MTNDFEYFEPATISDAIKLLDKYGEEAKLLAGGTDLLVDMKGGNIKPKYLINIMKIPELNYIIEDGEDLKIGAGTTFREIEESKVVREKFNVIMAAVKSLGTVQVRNMATIGGNICNALPSADTPPAILVLDARVKVVGKNGERVMPLEDFFSGVRKTRLAHGELLKEINVKRPPARSGTAFIKLSKTAEDLATLNAAARVTLADNGKCVEARVVLGGGVGPSLIRSKEAEKFLEGKTLDEATAKEAAEITCSRIEGRTSSIRASPYYKVEVGKVLVRRALLKALENAKGGS